MVIPPPEDLVSAIKVIREEHPDLGRAKVHQKLLENNPDWELSDKRLKKAIDSHHLSTTEHELHREAEKVASQSAPVLPPNPLRAQLRYKDQSTRMFILYGVEYDFGVSPNSDMGIFIDICQNRIVDFLKACGNKPTKEESHTLATSPPIQSLWRFYQAAAKKSGISAAHVLRQFQAEYCCDPQIGEEKDAAKKAELERRELEEHRTHKIEILRALVTKAPPGTIELDHKGDPVYQEWKRGKYSLIIARIDKKTGREIGTL